MRLATATLVIFALVIAAAPAPTTAAASDVRIAIIDSGIDASHSQFSSSSIVAWRDFVNGQNAPYDDHGHGTAVASRAVGTSLGAFPGASLIVAKVLSGATGSASWNHVNNAIRWAVDEGADVINISLGDTALPDPANNLLSSLAIQYATDHGVVVVKSAGNDGQETPHVNGHSPIPADVYAVTANSQVLTVGASTAGGAPAGFSQWNPEVLAHGENVIVAQNGGGLRFGSGTSFSAPFIAGVIAGIIAEDPVALQGGVNDAVEGLQRVNWLKWVVLHVALDDPGLPYLEEGYGYLSWAQYDRAIDIAQGDWPMPGADSRDAFHWVSLAVRSAQCACPPTGGTPP